jgi:hypothetical protein
MAEIYPPIFVPYGIEEVVTIMMDLLAWETGQWKEGVARLELPCVGNLYSERVIMINNSSFDKWQRLAHKQLDQQFINEIIHGLDCSPFEASAILDMVYRVYAPYFETSPTLKPGQILFQVISVETSANTPLSHSKQVTVVLTFDAGIEDLKVRQSQGIQALRQHRMQRMCIEAFQQGGLLTIEDLANRLFNCGQRTLSRDLEALRRQAIVLPLRSMIKDMGRSISHRSLIIEQWLRGKEYSEIARHTHHSISSVQNYVSKFKRVVALAEEGYDIHTIAFLVTVSASLAESYHELYRRMNIVPHRLKELTSFPKKGTHQIPRARWQ